MTYKGYLYYTTEADYFGCSLYRVNTSGYNNEYIGILGHGKSVSYPPYVISGSKIFYLKYNENGGASKKAMSMSLNGRNQKRVSGKKIKMKYETANAGGYAITKQ